MCAILHTINTEEFISPLSQHYNISALCGNETVQCKLYNYTSRIKYKLSQHCTAVHCTLDQLTRVHFHTPLLEPLQITLSSYDDIHGGSRYVLAQPLPSPL